MSIVSNREHAEKLFGELGPLLEPVAIVYDEEEAHWAVMIDGDQQIDVVYDEQVERFVFAMDLGAVPEESAETIHELLLRFSFVWRQTGGLHAALDDEGHAVLMYKHAVQGLDVQTLQGLLGGLHTHLEYWCDLIANTGSGEDFSEAPEEIAAPLGIIRP